MTEKKRLIDLGDYFSVNKKHWKGTKVSTELGFATDNSHLKTAQEGMLVILEK